MRRKRRVFKDAGTLYGCRVRVCTTPAFEFKSSDKPQCVDRRAIALVSEVTSEQ